MSYNNEVLADRPVLYWRLNESSGAAQDSSGNAMNSNNPGNPPTYAVDGLITGSSNRAVTFSNTSLLSATDAEGLWSLVDWAAEANKTVELWFRGSSVGGGIVQCLFGKMNQWASLNGWKVAFDETDQLCVRLGATTNFIAVAGAGWLDGRTHHLVITRECVEPRLTLYIDGVQVASVTTAGLDGGQQTSQGFCVGNDTSQTRGFVGTIDEVALYTSVLSPTRIAAHYQAGTGSTVLLEDSFTRSVTDSWGTPDKGDTYTVFSNPSGAGALDVNGSAGTVSPTSSGSHIFRLNKSLCDISTTGRWKTNQVPTNAGGHYVRTALFRSNGSNTGYVVHFFISDAGALTLRLARQDTGAPIPSDAALGTYTPDTWWRWRVEARGSSIKTKAWLDGTTEPSAWTHDITNTLFSVADDLFFGMAVFNVGQVTSFDDIRYEELVPVPRLHVTSAGVKRA